MRITIKELNDRLTDSNVKTIRCNDGPFSLSIAYWMSGRKCLDCLKLLYTANLQSLMSLTTRNGTELSMMLTESVDKIIASNLVLTFVSRNGPKTFELSILNVITYCTQVSCLFCLLQYDPYLSKMSIT